MGNPAAGNPYGDEWSPRGVPPAPLPTDPRLRMQPYFPSPINTPPTQTPPTQAPPTPSQPPPPPGPVSDIIRGSPLPGSLPPIFGPGDNAPSPAPGNVPTGTVPRNPVSGGIIGPGGGTPTNGGFVPPARTGPIPANDMKNKMGTGVIVPPQPGQPPAGGMYPPNRLPYRQTWPGAPQPQTPAPTPAAPTPTPQNNPMMSETEWRDKFRQEATQRANAPSGVVTQAVTEPAPVEEKPKAKPKPKAKGGKAKLPAENSYEGQKARYGAAAAKQWEAKNKK